MNSPDIILQVSKSIATFLSPFILGALQNKIKSRAKSKNVEQVRIDQLSSFLAFDVKSRNRLVVEQQFRTIFGALFEYCEILCALNGRSPLKALTLMRAVHHLVAFDFASQRFTFAESYSTASKRTRRRWLFFIAYGSAVYASFWPWYFALSGAVQWGMVLLLSISTVCFLALAWAALDLATDVGAAERFIAAVEPFSIVDSSIESVPQHQSRTTVNISIAR